MLFIYMSTTFEILYILDTYCTLFVINFPLNPCDSVGWASEAAKLQEVKRDVG